MWSDIDKDTDTDTDTPKREEHGIYSKPYENYTSTFDKETEGMKLLDGIT